jgi:hypothetical protein
MRDDIFDTYDSNINGRWLISIGEEYDPAFSLFCFSDAKRNEF